MNTKKEPTKTIKKREVPVLTNKDNKDIIQSYIITSARYDFSVYEKRILYRIVEANQEVLENKHLSNKYIIDTDLFNTKSYLMPISCFLNSEEDKNHKRIKEAFRSLEDKSFMYEDDDIITSIRLVRKFEINKRSGFVRFSLDLPIYSALIDFSKGYKKYELQTAMQFESVYSMRFYELMSGQKEPIEFKIGTLKEMFSISDKYKRVNDFLRYVLDVAKKELDEKSPYSFEYEPLKQGRAYYSILFFPKYNPKNRDTELERRDLQKQVSLSWDLPRNIVDYLKHNFGFTTDGIKNNIDLFKSAHDKIDLIEFLASIKGKVRESKNPQGYVIGAIRKQICIVKIKERI